uniref:hypothetical protein n=1 Tax=Streptococcus anginosus TaxID=1328 RepID=UPI002ED98529
SVKEHQFKTKEIQRENGKLDFSETVVMLKKTNLKIYLHFHNGKSSRTHTHTLGKHVHFISLIQN